MSPSYRQAMFTAFSVPTVLFIVLPLAIVALLGSGPARHGLSVLTLLAAILVPLYATGFVLAPWAGRRIPDAKAPAFLMAAAAALSPVVLFLFVVAVRGELGSSFGAVLFFAFFALPASMLGALLFIGRCQRLNAVTSH